MQDPRAWAQEDIDLLSHEWTIGTKASEIAKMLEGRHNRNSIIGKTHRLNLRKGTKQHQGQPQNGPPWSGKPLAAKAAPAPRAAPVVIKPPMPVPIEPAYLEAQPAPSVPVVTPGVLFMDVEPDQCRWPLNDPHPFEQFRFCGAAKPEGDSYCPHHRSKASHAWVNPRNRNAP